MANKSVTTSSITASVLTLTSYTELTGTYSEVDVGYNINVITVFETGLGLQCQQPFPNNLDNTLGYLTAAEVQLRYTQIL